MSEQAALVERLSAEHARLSALMVKCAADIASEPITADEGDACERCDEIAAACQLLKEAADALSAAPAPAWQGMDSAPKDGTLVLVWSSGTGKWPRLAKWCSALTPGWWGLDHAQTGSPMFWMPLPASPDATAETPR